MEAFSSRAARNRKNNKRNSHAKKEKRIIIIRKITITVKTKKITNQGTDTDKYNESLKESSEMITNQVYISVKHNKSLKESRERSFTNVTKIPKTTLILDYSSF